MPRAQECKAHFPGPATHDHPQHVPSCPWCIVERQIREIRILRAALIQSARASIAAVKEGRATEPTRSKGER